MAWYEEAPTGTDDNGFVVVEAKMGASRADKALPAWKREALARVSVMVSVALAATMEAIKKNLAVVMENEAGEAKPVEGNWKPQGDWFVKTATLGLFLGPEKAADVRALLAQPEKPYGYTNAYRFVRLSDALPDGRFLAEAEIGKGEWKEKKGKEGAARIHALSLIQATTGLQRLIESYLRPSEFLALPRALRDGVAQEASQQLTSYLGQLESVTGEVAFPTVEDRDPSHRQYDYADALDSLGRDARPLHRITAREAEPGKYAADDPKGNRLVMDDERWLKVARSPEPHPIPLFFTDGGSVRLEYGEARFDAGVSKADRHRGNLVPSERVRQGRPDKTRERGFTRIREYFALLPVLDGDDETLRSVLSERDARKAANLGSRGRHLALEKTDVALAPAKNVRDEGRYLRVPLSFDRGRFEHILGRKDLSVAWAKAVCRDGEWFLQLTLRVPYGLPTGRRKVLGVAFDTDAIMSWTLLDEDGRFLEGGAEAPNPQIVAFLKEKRQVEWDQAKGRWVGGREFEGKLETIAHQVSNRAVALARAKGAVLAVHDVEYVQKSGPDSDLNVLFTAWNYGQLRRFLEYKAPLAGLGIPAFTNDYLVRLTCPSCGACRSAKQKPEVATTWRTKGVLHCRKCDYEGTPTNAENALRVAEHGLTVWRRWWQKEEEKKQAAAQATT